MIQVSLDQLFSFLFHDRFQRPTAVTVKTKSYRNAMGLLVLGLTLGGLWGCGSQVPDGEQTGESELEFWTMQLQPDFTDYFTTLIGQFETENPTLKVRWVDVPWNAMESKILTAVSAGTAPDVVNLNPKFASQLASRKAWLELDPLIDINIRDRYLPKVWQASALQDSSGTVRSFGIPWYLTSRIAIYNQDLLQAAEVKAPPKTYAELATIAQQVKEKTGKYAFFVTFVPTDSAEVMESLVQMGVTLVDAQGKAGFNTTAGQAAFQYWVDLYQKGLLPQEVLTQGHRRAIELYQSGETAILSSSPEFFKTIATNAPSIAAVSAASSQITGETNKKNVAVMNLVIPEATDQPQAALDFALFVTNSKNQLAFAQTANVLPSTLEAVTAYEASLTNADTQSDPSTIALAQARSVSASQLEDAEVLVPVLTDGNVLQKILYENLQAAMLKEKTVSQALTDAESEWNDRPGS
jgi:putative chitobiose transport system substrate-binding protein